MEIRKRNGESVPFQQEKIFNAMKKAFDGQGKEIGSRELDEILATVLDNLSVTVPLTVERVQDEVERTLMERGHYEVAKAYILYREKRSALRRVRHTIARTVGDDSLDELLRRIQMDFTEDVQALGFVYALAFTPVAENSKSFLFFVFTSPPNAIGAMVTVIDRKSVV